MDKQLLTIPEAAEMLSTSERHVRRLVAERRLTFVKLGGKVRFRIAVLDAYIADNTVEAQQ